MDVHFADMLHCMYLYYTLKRIYINHHDIGLLSAVFIMMYCTVSACQFIEQLILLTVSSSDMT